MATESSPRPASSPVSPCSWCSELVPDINAHQSSCKMKKALCSFCQEPVLESELSGHQETCTHRKVLCPHCHSAFPIGSHTECPKERIHHECGVFFLREEALAHAKVCELALILCPHGCGKTVIRRDADRHLEENPTAHEVASMRRLYAFTEEKMSTLTEIVVRLDRKVDTLSDQLVKLASLEEEKRALAVAEEIIQPLVRFRHKCTLGHDCKVTAASSNWCPKPRPSPPARVHRVGFSGKGHHVGHSVGPCDSECQFSSFPIERRHHCSVCQGQCLGWEASGGAYTTKTACVHCPECDEFSVPPFTTFEPWSTERTEATTVGRPGNIHRISPDGKHRVMQDYVWLPGDHTAHQQGNRYSQEQKLVVDISNARIQCACNRPGAAVGDAAGAGAGAGTM